MDLLQLVMGRVRGAEGAQAPVVRVDELNTACDFRVCSPTNVEPNQRSCSYHIIVLKGSICSRMNNACDFRVL